MDGLRVVISGLKRLPLRWFAALLVLSTLQGCASVVPTESGFLTDYSQIHATNKLFHWGLGYHHFSTREATPSELTGIDSFYIEPIAWIVPETDWLANDPTRKERVTKAFDSHLRTKLGEIRPIVCQPGPNTARVRAAVTDVNSARTITNLLASIVFGPVSNGGASVEVELINPQGVQIAALTGASRGGALDMVGYYWRSNHAKSATRRLSADFAESVKEAELPNIADVR